MKVLLISYYFPPAGGSGVQRTLKFVKYLPQFGCEPVVLTARGADYPTLDESLLSEVPHGIKVHRSKIVEPYALYRRLTGRSGAEHLDVAVLSRDETETRRWSERISEWVRSTFFIPDARVGWLPFAARDGLTLLRDGDIKVILSTAPPYTCHLVGLVLHRLSGKPWIADFRDSWVDWVSAPKRRGLSRRIDCFLEGRVLRRSTRVLAVTAGVANDLRSRNRNLNGSCWHLLPNGFDAADFADVRAAPKVPGKLTLIYTGSMYGARRPTTVLEGLGRLIDEDEHLASRLRLLVVGRVAENLQRELRSGPWRRLVELHDYVPHRRSLELLLAADAALLLIDDMPASKGVLTGKLFEYLGARKPILAVAPPDGEAAALIRELDAGWVVRPRDAEGAHQALRQMLASWSTGTLPVLDDRVLRYERRELTRRLAELLKRTADEARDQ